MAMAPSAVAADCTGPTVPSVDGEYKPVSVLYGGLHHAATFVDRLGPERLYHVMQTVMVLTHEVVQQYAGTLLPHASGEGFTAVFGAPIAPEGHARRAVVAAPGLHARLPPPPAPGSDPA